MYNRILSIHDYKDDKNPTVFMSYMTLQRRWCHSHDEVREFTQYDRNIEPDAEKLQAMLDKNDEASREEAYEAIMWANHFTMLNGMPSVAGMKWPVTEKIWWYFYEILPPLYYREKTDGFMISEACHGDVRSAYYREGDQYWHEYVVYHHEE